MNNFMIFAVVIITHVFSSSVLAESSVWKVSKGQNYFYLGGTVHVLTENDYPFPNEFSSAYKDSSKIIFETDIAALETPEFESMFITAMSYNDDRTLASELNTNTYQKLDDFMVKREIPIDNFSTFQPWGVSLIITMIEYQRFGMVPDYGVDRYFNNLALADSKEVGGLETAEQQLGFLSSLATIDPNLSIEYTLRDLKNLPEFIQTIRTSWRSGDLDQISSSQFVKQMKVEFPEMYNAIVTNRNNTWMKQLPALIDDKATEFVLVGAMHLIGKEGLLHQLKTQGFNVEQL